MHHFYKEVSGTPLIRPAWYYDVEQQGEGIADVTTHLIDLLFWKCFSGQSIDYTRDIGNISSSHWATEITLPQFTKSTGETAFPDYLQKYLNNSILEVYANGTLHFDVKHRNVGLKVIWNYQAPEGGGDTFMSVVKGTKTTLDENEFSGNLQKAIEKIRITYPFVSASPTAAKGEYIINIPVENREGHESHFKYVAESFFNFLINRSMAEWEKTNTLAKYYITTKAVEVAEDRD
ncbi:hypothetical protein SDC9_121651 [bioreactor metagenome]|uniref:Putative oxidoreductase C-terminal domain-containing protein n=1 Tax=bioreactor metagenome TaxID=1076179 RepID=A0A645CCQ6_9ZZZZ